VRTSDKYNIPTATAEAIHVPQPGLNNVKRATQHKRSRGARRLAIGYWHSLDCPANEPVFPHPHALVDRAWESARRVDIVNYLKTGFVYAWSTGYSYCRFCCTAEQDTIKLRPDARTRIIRDADGKIVDVFTPACNGFEYCCDDVWCWPSGLAHYVECHDLRLPDEFVAHAAARGFQPAPKPAAPFSIDYSFWMEWADRNAPFAPDLGCLACVSTPPHCR